MNSVEEQLRHDLHVALDQPTTNAALNPAALMARGSRTIRRRRIVMGAVGAAAAATIGLATQQSLTGPDRTAPPPVPAHSIGTPERVTVSVQDPSAADATSTDLSFDVTGVRFSDDSITLTVRSETNVPHTARFSRGAVANGTATAWLDPHTLVAATPSGSMTQILTEATDNVGSGSSDLPDIGINVSVMSFRASMGEASPIGLVWRDAAGGLHGSPNSQLQHLRITEENSPTGPYRLLGQCAFQRFRCGVGQAGIDQLLARRRLPVSHAV